jgi:hypothetical protein
VRKPNQLLFEELERQGEEFRKNLARWFLRECGWTHDERARRARRFLREAIKEDEAATKKSRGKPLSISFWMLQKAAEIQRQHPNYSEDKALLAAGVPEKKVRYYKDYLNREKKTLAECAAWEGFNLPLG